MNDTLIAWLLEGPPWITLLAQRLFKRHDMDILQESLL